MCKGGVAHGLADKGCRVMLLGEYSLRAFACFLPTNVFISHQSSKIRNFFPPCFIPHMASSTLPLLSNPHSHHRCVPDLWGRGYSDAPLNIPQDTRLFTTAILLALASSPLSWTGSSTFALVGYSLGGGICVSFTSYFPSLVSSLILLAPAGLVRAQHINGTNKFLYSTGLVPETVVEHIIRKRLQGGPSAAVPIRTSEESKKTSAADAVTEEIPKFPDERGASFNNAVLSKSRPHITVAAAVAWQTQFHHGFIKSFISSIRYGPILDRQAEWKRVGARLAAQNASSEDRYEIEGLQHGKVLIICGNTDPIIVKNELVEDATEVLGENCVRFKFCDAGHELPIVRSKMIVGQIWEFWETGS